MSGVIVGTRFRVSGLRARLLPWLLTLIALAGCTGTQEESIPILLVVGSVESGVPQIQLFEDVRDPLANPARDLLPVAGSVRTLPAPPVSFDVVDRNGARSELVVLDESGVVHFYDLSDLPGSFVTSRSPVNVMNIIPAEATVGPSTCLVQLQVTGTAADPGRYAALLDSCDGQNAEIYVLDLLSQSFLYALSLEHPGFVPLPVGIYVDQDTGLLFFATDEITDTMIQMLPITGELRPEELGLTPIDPLEAVDLSPVTFGIGLLSDEVLAVVPFDGDSQSLVDVDLVGAEALLPDPTGNVELLVAFSDSRGALVDGLDDEEAEPLFLQEPFADATLEPVQRFAYLLEEGGIEILDLFPYADPPANRLLFVDLPGLADPRVITWAFGTQVP